MMKELRTYGKTVKVVVKIYPECKYTYQGTESKKVEYDGLVNWEIINGEDAKEIEEETDGSCIDDYHEYLVLHFEDNTTATFRNSYVDMFRR